MAILIDFSQIILSNLFAQIRPGQPIEEDLIRHMVLNSIRSYKQKFEDKFGSMIICMDSRHYWRKDVFPYYKFKRKEDRDNSDFDWDTIWACIHRVKDELQQFMPYKIMEVYGAEADDIIAVLSKNLSRREKVLIISGDKDFPQLQKYPNISQFAPVEKEWKKTDDPEKFLKIHIMKGDTGDSIPNFLTQDDFFLRKSKGENIRQKSLMSEKLELWSTLPPERFCTTEMMHGWSRNETLVDLDKIPSSVLNTILEAYRQPFDSSNSRMFDYFMKYSLKLLLKDIRQFHVIQKEKEVITKVICVKK